MWGRLGCSHGCSQFPVEGLIIPLWKRDGDFLTWTLHMCVSGHWKVSYENGKDIGNQSDSHLGIGSSIDPVLLLVHSHKINVYINCIIMLYWYCFNCWKQGSRPCKSSCKYCGEASWVSILQKMPFSFILIRIHSVYAWGLKVSLPHCKHLSPWPFFPAHVTEMCFVYDLF